MVDDRADELANWTVREDPPNTTVTNNDGTLDGQTDYMDLYDNSGTADARIKQTLPVTQAYGTFYFKTRSTDVTLKHAYNFTRSGANQVQILIDDDKVQANYADSWHDLIDPASDDHWYDIQIDVETTAGGYLGLNDDSCNITIDSTLYVDNQLMSNRPNDVFNEGTAGTDDADSGYHLYVDSWYYSWDPSSNLGTKRNRKPLWQW